MVLISSRPESQAALRYCLYARKSMEADDRQALSIESQLKEMQTIAERDALNVVVIKTESHSAKNSGERPVFNELIEELKAGKYNAILTWNPDRLSRNAGDLGQLVDLMDKGLLVGITTYGQTFANSPNEKFLLMILCSQAKLENDNKVINVKRGLRARVEMGLWPCVAPTGYLNSKMKDEPGVKLLDPERAPIVRQIFERVAYERQSGHQILRWLHSIDFRSRPGGKLINLSSVQQILKRPFYYGVFEYPVKSGNFYKGKHKPIITKKLYEQAREVIDWHTTHKKYFPNFERAPFAFLHMLRCGSCGSGITALEKYKRIRKTKEIVGFRYYVCSRNKDRDCREGVMPEKVLISELYNVLDRVDIDLIGMREYLDQRIEKYYGFQSFVDGIPTPVRSPEKKEYDLRKFAQVVFENGTIEEKREILKNLKSRLIIKDRSVYIDNVPEIDNGLGQISE